MEMPPQQVEVVACSRLHFGMFSFGVPGERQFGGAGVMIDRPGLRLRVERGERFEARGLLAGRVTSVASGVAQRLRLENPPPYVFDLVEAAPEHVGLGTGTQLALAVASAMVALGGDEQPDAARLAALAGRGQRSAVGSYGFERGGLIVEAGKLDGEALAPLTARVELPAEWRFVVTWPPSERGLAGEAERATFRELPPIEPATTARLRAEVEGEMLPAARAGDFKRFGESLYRFGRLAGKCFAAAQGGVFASERIARLVEAIRALGVAGVGQSSWGPSVFALLENPAAADAFAGELRSQVGGDDEIVIARPSASGARIVRGQP